MAESIVLTASRCQTLQLVSTILGILLITLIESIWPWTCFPSSPENWSLKPAVLVMRTRALYASRKLLALLILLILVSTPVILGSNPLSDFIMYLMYAGIIWHNGWILLVPLQDRNLCVFTLFLLSLGRRILLPWFSSDPAFSDTPTASRISGCLVFCVAPTCHSFSVVFWLPFILLETSEWSIYCFLGLHLSDCWMYPFNNRTGSCVLMDGVDRVSGSRCETRFWSLWH